jgi:hypothetical protein
VIQDHLRVAAVLSRGRLSEFDQILCVESGVSVAFEPA